MSWGEGFRRKLSDDMRKAGIEGEMRGGDDGSGRAIGG